MSKPCCVLMSAWFLTRPPLYYVNISIYLYASCSHKNIHNIKNKCIFSMYLKYYVIDLAFRPFPQTAHADFWTTGATQWHACARSVEGDQENTPKKTLCAPSFPRTFVAPPSCHGACHGSRIRSRGCNPWDLQVLEEAWAKDTPRGPST